MLTLHSTRLVRTMVTSLGNVSGGRVAIVAVAYPIDRPRLNAAGPWSSRLHFTNL